MKFLFYFMEKTENLCSLFIVNFKNFSVEKKVLVGAYQLFYKKILSSKIIITNNFQKKIYSKKISRAQNQGSQAKKKK